VDAMVSPATYRNNKEILYKTFRSRKGVCQGFSEVMTELCSLSGIPAYVVTGYTRQNKKIDPLPHAWVLAKTEEGWFFYDPTWGAGYIDRDVYHKDFNKYFFKVEPEEMIRSHMPFDPIWQLLETPVAHKEFISGKFQKTYRRVDISHMDTIHQNMHCDDPKRLNGIIKRVTPSAGTNAMVDTYLENTKNELEVYYNNLAVNQYNKAAEDFNEVVKLLNNFITYRNKLFKPTVPDAALKQKLTDIELKLQNISNSLDGIRVSEESVNQSVASLQKSISEVKPRLESQQVFLKKYIATPVSKRKALFYRKR
jgi:uncharacterized membrane-anchored protein YhcB (DUF1043 family)